MFLFREARLFRVVAASRRPMAPDRPRSRVAHRPRSSAISLWVRPRERLTFAIHSLGAKSPSSEASNAPPPPRSARVFSSGAFQNASDASNASSSTRAGACGPNLRFRRRARREATRADAPPRVATSCSPRRCWRRPTIRGPTEPGGRSRFARTLARLSRKTRVALRASSPPFRRTTPRASPRFPPPPPPRRSPRAPPPPPPPPPRTCRRHLSRRRRRRRRSAPRLLRRRRPAFRSCARA